MKTEFTLTFTYIIGMLLNAVEMLLKYNGKE